MTLPRSLAAFGLCLACCLALALFSSGCSTAQTKTLWDYRVEADAKLDADLLAGVTALDQRVRAELSMDEEARAFGVLDLGVREFQRPLERSGASIRYAALRPNALFYGASVPKIGILLGYFEAHPAAAQSLEPEVRRELELMIKRSSNELAAKYSQLVGLERLREIYTAPRYQLYEEPHGGLWTGKHYGLDQPRSGDPIGDLSHAVTVRQCLRYYLMLEQGALVSPRASIEMQNIFAAPQLEFHDDNFVAGLRGRDVVMIRKNGQYADWYLDTARVATPTPDGRGEHIYLLAGATEHPRGSEYLERMAAGVHALVLPEASDRPPIHQYLRLDRVAGLDSDAFESEVIEAPHPFNRILLSFNAATPADGGVAVDLRVAPAGEGGGWSPWLELGYWGENPPDRGPKEFDGGKVDVDVFRSDRRYRELQYRVRARGEVAVSNIAVTASDTTGMPHSRYPRHRFRSAEPTGAPVVRLEVPFRSQKAEKPELAPRICSPTSVAMILEYHGIDQPTEQIAHEIFDADFDLFGNWPRAVQAAYAHGLPGTLRAFGSMTELYPFIERRLPVVISIRAGEGELTGAPYAETSGHLLVVTGFDGSGNVHVNDPAASTEAAGRTTYDRGELERAWQRAGGITYVFDPTTPAGR